MAQQREDFERRYALEKSRRWIEKGQLFLDPETGKLDGPKAEWLFYMSPALDQEAIDQIKQWCREAKKKGADGPR